jgi:Mor family transcriptional regulator
MFTLEDIIEETQKGTPIHEMYKKFGGFSIYIPKVMRDYKELVINEFNGYNYAFLATKYNVSTAQVYKIIRDHKALE